MNRSHRLVVIGLCGLGALCAAPAKADDNPFVGRWHWNRAASTLPPGEPPPADLMADFSRIDTAHIRWSITVTNTQGQPSVMSFDSPANGEFYSISSDTMAAFSLVGPTLQATFKGPDNQTDTLKCSLSNQQKRMTCNGVITEGTGKPQSYVDVYDRQ